MVSLYLIRYLGMVLYHAGDVGGALVQQHRELIINERCLGLDHPDTAHRYARHWKYHEHAIVNIKDLFCLLLLKVN